MIKMNYRVLTLKEKDEWDRLLTSLPPALQDIYYSPGYYSLYENYGDGKAMCFFFEMEEDMALYPFLMNSVNDLGYDLNKEYYDIQGAYGYNGVISTNYSVEFINAFYISFNQFCKELNIIAEFTRFNPYIRNQTFSRDHVHAILNRNTIILDLENSYNEIWLESYSSRNRNMIRKARKNDSKIEIRNTIHGSDEFNEIYSDTMKLLNVSPYFFFSAKMFHEMLDSSNYNFLFAVDNKNLTSAAMILITYGEYAHYHLSGRVAGNKDNSVNNYLLDEAIKIAISKKAKKFHFGGGNSLDPKDALMKFKRNFSKNQLDFFIGGRIHNSHIYKETMNQWEAKFPINDQVRKNKVLAYRDTYDNE